MNLGDEEFFESNTTHVNIIVARILVCLNIIPLLFIVLSRINVFQIGTYYAFVMECISLLFTCVHLFLVYFFARKKIISLYPEAAITFQHIAKYFGLMGTSILLGFLGSHAHIGIYISYGLIVFMSGLYYSVRTTNVITIFSYLVMLVSLYFKSINRAAEGMMPATAFWDFVAFGSGFTIEFFFVWWISVSIARRSKRTLNRAIEQNNLLRNTQFEIMDFIPKILESHELFTGHHVKHTVKYVDVISRELARQGNYVEILNEETITLYAAAANLHDIGKVHIPDNILNKPGKFTDEEYAMMKAHPAEGKKLIESLPRIKGGLFNEVAMQMAYYHHEKYDGTGYPSGISGKAIPLCARIMAAADVLDALLSWRPYKEPYDIDKVMEIFEQARGAHFESCIVDAVISLKPIIYMLAQDFKTREMEDEEKEFAWRVQLQEGRMRSNSS